MHNYEYNILFSIKHFTFVYFILVSDDELSLLEINICVFLDIVLVQSTP